jgi:hypothetical protein
VTPRRRRRLLIALGVLVVLNGIVAAAYTVPRASGERRLAERKKELALELQRERAVAEKRYREVETIRANTADVQRFYASTVGDRSGNLVRVLSAVEGFAREGGMRPGGATYKEQDVKGLPLDRFVITMPVSGTYRQLVALVQRLERSQYFLTLDEIRLSGDAQASKAELALTMSCYFKAASGGAP